MTWIESTKDIILAESAEDEPEMVDIHRMDRGDLARYQERHQ
jgi:hypothetical protein